jgi:16S rRNA (guanine527-N7)-methyltransferase
MSDGTVAEKLNHLLAEAGQQTLDPEIAAKFEAYLALLRRWNARTNLTAIRDEDGILRRHFLESIVCARAIPGGVGTLLDLGSGAGFPGIPIALWRTEIAVTLAESQGKKAAFLREASRVLGGGFAVHAARAETLSESFDCVTLRAVDRMDEAVRAGLGRVVPGGWVILFTTTAEAKDLQAVAASAGRVVSWREPVVLPAGSDRILLIGHIS